MKPNRRHFLAGLLSTGVLGIIKPAQAQTTALTELSSETLGNQMVVAVYGANNQLIKCVRLNHNELDSYVGALGALSTDEEGTGQLVDQETNEQLYDDAITAGETVNEQVAVAEAANFVNAPLQHTPTTLSATMLNNLAQLIAVAPNEPDLTTLTAYPASMIKKLTTFTICKLIDAGQASLDEQITVGPIARLHVDPGVPSEFTMPTNRNSFSLHELLTFINSGSNNDACEAVAYHFGRKLLEQEGNFTGNHLEWRERFMTAMRTVAANDVQMNMAPSQCTISNPSGLPPEMTFGDIRYRRRRRPVGVPLPGAEFNRLSIQNIAKLSAALSSYLNNPASPTWRQEVVQTFRRSEDYGIPATIGMHGEIKTATTRLSGRGLVCSDCTDGNVHTIVVYHAPRQGTDYAGRSHDRTIRNLGTIAAVCFMRWERGLALLPQSTRRVASMPAATPVATAAPSG